KPTAPRPPASRAARGRWTAAPSTAELGRAWRQSSTGSRESGCDRTTSGGNQIDRSISTPGTRLAVVKRSPEGAAIPRAGREPARHRGVPSARRVVGRETVPERRLGAEEAAVQ